MLAEGPVFAIKISDQRLNQMDEWNTKQHGQSGLVDRVRRSKVTLAEAEAETIKFWVTNGLDSGKSPMCGNLSAKIDVFWRARCRSLSALSLSQFRCVVGKRAVLSLAS